MKYILIDTKNKTYGTNNNFTYYLSDKITINEYVKLKYLYLPRMDYMINDINNSFNIIINNNTYTIKLDNQLYTP
jgi:hypothetical protein